MSDARAPEQQRLERLLGPLLTICGLVGAAAAFVLAVEKVRLLENPFYVPSCSFSEVLSCTAVMQSDQAAAFGVPNPFIGLVGFGLVIATGLALLAGGRLAEWYWLGLASIHRCVGCEACERLAGVI